MHLSVGVYAWGVMKLTPSFTFTYKPPNVALFTKQCERALMMSEYVHDDYTPNFTVSDIDYNREYRSMFGPFFLIKDLNFSGSGAGEYRAAVSRLIADPTPEKPGYVQRLANNQNDLGRRFKQPLRAFKALLEKNIERGEWELVHLDWLNRPSPKLGLRKRCDQQCRDNGGNYHDDHKPADGNLKSGELLPDGDRKSVV